MTSIEAKAPDRVGRWLLLGILALTPLLVFRFVAGLGAVTNLSDEYPWGLWKAFNVVAVIGLGAAGFTTMAIVHVFQLHEYRSVGRLAVLTAFLAYASVSFSLALDIGRPWAIWHPIVMWNPHSVLFEVAWCLMLYTTVLLLEGSSMIFERLGRTKVVEVLHRITTPVVIAGVVLSTLHQSSLGALFLLVPGKLHPIWYTEALPLLFFLSSVAVGIAMVLLLSRVAVKRLGARIQTAVLADLGRILLAVLCLYGAVRLLDLVERGVHVTAFSTCREGILFQAEFLVGVLVPGLLLAINSVRESGKGLTLASSFVVVGFVAHRLHTCIVGFEAAQGGRYVPSASEVLLTVFVLLVVTYAFRMGVRFLDVLPGRPTSAARGIAGH